jgi:hypothetical protein
MPHPQATSRIGKPAAERHICGKVLAQLCVQCLGAELLLQGGRQGINQGIWDQYEAVICSH